MVAVADPQSEVALHSLAFRFSLKPTIICMIVRLFAVLSVGDLPLAALFLGGIVIAGVCLAAAGRHDEDKSHELYSHAVLLGHLALVALYLPDWWSCERRVDVPIPAPALARHALYLFSVHVAVAPPFHRAVHVVLGLASVLYSAAIALRGLPLVAFGGSSPNSDVTGVCLAVGHMVPELQTAVLAAWGGSAEHRGRLKAAGMLLAQFVAKAFAANLAVSLLAFVDPLSMYGGKYEAPKIETEDDEGEPMLLPPDKQARVISLLQTAAFRASVF